MPVPGTISYDAASKTVTFTPSSPLAEGTYHATIAGYGEPPRVEDKADNVLRGGWSYIWSFSTGTVTVDKSAPTGTVSINDGASRTRTRSVTLTLSATDPSPGSGVSQMRISNTQSGLSSASWEPYSTTKAWTLTAGQGTKTVYVQYRDGAGNRSAVVTDTIRYKR